MQGKDIYIGTVKKCTNLYWYEKYGDEHYYGDFRIGSTEVGTVHKYTDVIQEKAILIKVRDKYIWVDLLTNKLEEILANLGISINALSEAPSFDGDYFVDKKTLEPALENSHERVSVKKAKSLTKTLNQ